MADNFNAETYLDLNRSDPVLVVEAPSAQGWGFYQFPQLTRLPDHKILLTIQVADDSTDSYGKEGYRSFISSDEGTSWAPLPPEKQQTLRPFQNSLQMDNGEYLSLKLQENIPLEELELPLPAGFNMVSYNRTSFLEPFFFLKDLPKFMQGLLLNRYHKGKWIHSVYPTQTPSSSLRCSYGHTLGNIAFGDLRQLENGNIITGVYPHYFTSKNGAVDGFESIIFYESNDHGYSWKTLSVIPFQPDIDYDPNGSVRNGFTEPTWLPLKSGTWISCLRSEDGFPEKGPLYIAYSYDQGKSWTQPKVIHPYGVLPRLLQLNNGVVVLSYGRPGAQLRLSGDSEGKSWSAPFPLVEEGNTARDNTCGYTSLLALDDDQFLVAYSKFYPVKKKHLKKIFVQTCQVITKTRKIQHFPMIEAFTEMKTLYYPNGAIQYKIPYFEKKLYGTTKLYRIDGTLAAETVYVKDRLHGVQVFYHPDGTTPERKITWENDTVKGLIQKFDKRGNLLKEEFR